MALGKDQCVTCSHGKLIRGASINGEDYLNERINADEKKLLHLQDDMKELSSLLKAVARSLVREVIQHKVTVIFGKMPLLLRRNEEYYSCWMEVKNGKPKVDRKQYDQYLIRSIGKPRSL
jgi:hypothetical protein